MTDKPLHIQCFTHLDRAGLLASIPAALLRCGGWILHRCALSPNTIQFQIEFPGRSRMDVYATLISCGLEFTRDGHLALAESCLCQKLLPYRPGYIASLQLSILFLPEKGLYTLSPAVPEQLAADN